MKESRDPGEELLVQGAALGGAELLELGLAFLSFFPSFLFRFPAGIP